jgi:Flp pilus assembly protein CpaB
MDRPRNYSPRSQLIVQPHSKGNAGNERHQHRSARAGKSYAPWGSGRRVAHQGETRIGREVVTISLLQNILVLAVGESFGAMEQEAPPLGSDSVTLLVTVDQASLLAQARRDGTLSLVLRNEDDLEINEGLGETDDSDVLEQEKRARRQHRLRIERVD